MRDQITFNAVAYLSNQVDGRNTISTLDRGRDHLVAETPDAAARKWLSRQGADERRWIWKVIVWKHKPFPSPAPVYDGPTIVYEVREGRLVQVEVREPEPKPKPRP